MEWIQELSGNSDYEGFVHGIEKNISSDILMVETLYDFPSYHLKSLILRH